jgi:hypothetical protein
MVAVILKHRACICRSLATTMRIACRLLTGHCIFSFLAASFHRVFLTRSRSSLALCGHDTNRAWYELGRSIITQCRSACCIWSLALLDHLCLATLNGLPCGLLRTSGLQSPFPVFSILCLTEVVVCASVGPVVVECVDYIFITNWSLSARP